jgi:hypothetical protein
MDAVLPAFSFQNDELVINTATKSYRIRSWPEPSARELCEDGKWRGFRPEFRIVKPESEDSESNISHEDPTSLKRGPESSRSLPDALIEKHKAFAEFRSKLADHVAHAVERFQSHQWNLIDLLSKEEAVQDLADNNPVLAWCLSNNNQFRRLHWTLSPVTYARPHVQKKQVEILRWLGFPESHSMVRLMRKILPEAITPIDVRMLRQAVAEPEAAKLLAHLHVINAGIIGLACNLKLLPAVSPQLLAEIGNTDEERTRQPTADLMIDALYLMMAGQIRLRVPLFHSASEVREFHDRVLTELQRKKEEAHRSTREKLQKKKASMAHAFPSPPVQGTQDFVPLTTSEQLKAEGLHQRNCVGSYARKVKDGASISIYKVLSPERATLAIAPGPDGFWRRAEIECTGNDPVSRTTKAAVDQWLSRHSLSI